MGLIHVPEINRVTFKKGKTHLFIVPQPDVYKSPSNNIYVVFGEAQIEDLSAQAQQNAAEQYRQTPENAPVVNPYERHAGSDEANSGDFDPSDIEMILSQTDATRAQAIEALRENDGDVVNAIMSLS